MHQGFTWTDTITVRQRTGSRPTAGMAARPAFGSCMARAEFTALADLTSARGTERRRRVAIDGSAE
jgi:hypothetical protein